VQLDLADFDAIGVTSDLVVRLRTRAITDGVDVAATVAAPDGWHRTVVTARPSGHVVLGIRYLELSTSRWHNVSGALAARGWQLDEDEDGATIRFPPGTDPTDAAFELLAVVPIAGAPPTARPITARTADGTPVDLDG
jgi:hypothetical protein